MIIFLGDSITQWGNWKTLLPEFDIENYGVAGNTIYQVLDRVDELFEKKAHQLFLLIGINDLGENRHITEIVKDYNRLVELLIDNNVATEINLVSVLPIIESSWQKPGLTNSNIKKLNSEIKVKATENSIEFIDVNYLFTDESGQLNSEFTTDGLHLNKTGYTLYVKLIKEKINDNK